MEKKKEQERVLGQDRVLGQSMAMKKGVLQYHKSEMTKLEINRRSWAGEYGNAKGVCNAVETVCLLSICSMPKLGLNAVRQSVLYWSDIQQCQGGLSNAICLLVLPNGGLGISN